MPLGTGILGQHRAGKGSALPAPPAHHCLAKPACPDRNGQRGRREVKLGRCKEGFSSKDDLVVIACTKRWRHCALSSCLKWICLVIEGITWTKLVNPWLWWALNPSLRPWTPPSGLLSSLRMKSGNVSFSCCLPLPPLKDRNKQPASC